MKPALPAPMTPLEKLKADKQLARQKSEDVSRRLNENLLYIQQNTGVVLLAGISSLFFPGTKKESGNASPATLPAEAGARLGVADYLSLGRSMLPHIWNIARPVLWAWGIGKAQAFVLHKLTGRKKKGTLQ